MSAKDVGMSRQIANVRIYIERATGQLKTLHTKSSHTCISS